ncbi:hypothetical protein ACLOJK_027292 [Asimina triloba]
MLVLGSVMLKTLATVDDLDSPIRQSCWRAARSWLDAVERVGRYPDLLDAVVKGFCRLLTGADGCCRELLSTDLDADEVARDGWGRRSMGSSCDRPIGGWCGRRSLAGWIDLVGR